MNSTKYYEIHIFACVMLFMCNLTNYKYVIRNHFSKIQSHTYALLSLHVCIDHVNIVQNKSGYDVVDNSIVNAFNNPERSIVLDCVTVRGHENAVWEVPENLDQSQYTIASHSVYLSTITVVDPGMDIVVSLKCMSGTSKEYRIVTVTTGRC